MTAPTYTAYAPLYLFAYAVPYGKTLGNAHLHGTVRNRSLRQDVEKCTYMRHTRTYV